MEGLRVVFAGAGRTLVTLLIVLGAPAALGALRAVLSGKAVSAFTAFLGLTSRLLTHGLLEPSYSCCDARANTHVMHVPIHMVY